MTEVIEVEVPSEVAEAPVLDSTAGSSTDPPIDPPNAAEDAMDTVDSVDPPQSVDEQPEEPEPKPKRISRKSKPEAKQPGRPAGARNKPKPPVIIERIVERVVEKPVLQDVNIKELLATHLRSQKSQDLDHRRREYARLVRGVNV